MRLVYSLSHKWKNASQTSLIPKPRTWCSLSQSVHLSCPCSSCCTTGNVTYGLLGLIIAVSYHTEARTSLFISLSLSHTQFSTAFFSCFSTRTHDYNTRKQTEEEGGRTWNSQWALWHTASMRVRRAKRSWWWSGFGKPTYKSDEEHKTRGKKIQKQKNEKKVNEQNPSAWHEALRSVRQVYAEQVLSFQHRCSFTPVVHYIVSRTPSFNSDLCIVRLSHFSQPLELIKSRRISLSGL